jgi:hypothetical protein
MAVVAGAILLAGAATPTRGAAPLSTDTLAGPATQAARQDVSDQRCPTYQFEAPAETITLRGDREVWTATIAAADPAEVLTVQACLQEGSRTVRPITSGRFVIATASGKVRGGVTGLLDFDWREATGFRDVFVMKLDIANGTRSYRAADGDLWYSGCLEGDGILAAAVTTTEPTGPPAACL